MSIASRSATPWVASFLLLLIVLAPMQWQAPVRATDPVNGAIAEQQRIEAELARQRTQLAALQRRQAELSSSLQGISTDLASVGLEIRLAESQIEQATLDLAQAQGELRAYGFYRHYSPRETRKADPEATELS